MAYFDEFPHARDYDKDLGWLIQEMKKIIENVSAQNDKIAAVEQLAADLKDFVNNYFDNLDVQEEIDSKIDQMARDGSLLQLVEEPVTDAVADWLLNNLTPTSPPVDATLSILGAAADSGVTGAEIAGVLNELETLVFDEPTPIIVRYTGGTPGTSGPDPVASVNNYCFEYPQRITSWLRIYLSGSDYRAKIFYYDANMNFISESDWITATKYIYDAPTNAVYASLRVQTVPISNVTEQGKITTRENVYLCNLSHDYYQSRFKSPAEGTDLNDLQTPGLYSFAAAGSYVNMPDMVPATDAKRKYLLVYSGAGSESNYIVQRLNVFTASYNMNFIRVHTVAGGWSSWVSSGEYPFYFRAMTEKSDSVDLNDYMDFGLYSLRAATSYVNAPVDKVACSLFVLRGYETGEYRIQYFIDNASNDIYKRVHSGAPMTWKAWVKIYDFAKLNGLSRNETVTFTPGSEAAQGQNSGTNLRIVSYNICNFNYDTATYISDEKLCSLRKAIDEIDADILCCQEDRNAIDSGSTKDSNNYVYYPKYPNRYGAGGTTIHSKTELTGTTPMTLTSGRGFRYALKTIGSKVILVISAHPGLTTEVRAQDYTELFQWIAGTITLKPYGSTTGVYAPAHTHVIICGDMNSSTDADKTNLLNQCNTYNMKPANGGRYGWMNTAPRYSAGANAIDNIIVSNNIIINKTVVYTDLYGALYSDHVPVACDLTIL